MKIITVKLAELNTHLKWEDIASNSRHSRRGNPPPQLTQHLVSCMFALVSIRFPYSRSRNAWHEGLSSCKPVPISSRLAAARYCFLGLAGGGKSCWNARRSDLLFALGRGWAAVPIPRVICCFVQIRPMHFPVSWYMTWRWHTT